MKIGVQSGYVRSWLGKDNSVCPVERIVQLSCMPSCMLSWQWLVDWLQESLSFGSVELFLLRLEARCFPSCVDR